MAYYCIVTDLTRPSPGTIMVHFEMRDDADDSVVQADMTHGFQVTIRDANGAAITETGVQKRQRMAAEFTAYANRINTDAALVDQHFDALRTDAIGFRVPGA